MTNFDTAREALDASLNSSGSAMREHAKWSESLEARLNKLKSTWQSLSQTFMGSDFLKSVLDGVIGLVNGLDKLIDTIGVLPTFAGLFMGGKTLFGNSGGILKTMNADLDGFTNKIGVANKSFAELIQSYRTGKTGKGFKGMLGGLSSVKGSLGGLTRKDIANIQAYNNQIDQCVGSQTAFNRTMLTSSKAAQDLVAGANGGKVALQGLTTVTNASRVASIGAAVAATALNAAITMGVSFLISGAISLIQKWINAKEELAEKVEEVTSKFQEQHSELQKLKGDYDASNTDSMISRYGRLSKGVNELGENVSLTASEYSEYQSIIDTIASQFPNLVNGFNSQGIAIIDHAGDVEYLTQAYKDLILAENEAVLDTGADIFKDFKNDIEKTGILDKRYEIEYDQHGNKKSEQWVKYYNTNHLKNLKNLMGLGGKNLDEEINKLLPDDIKRISELLDEYGVERNKLGSGDAGWENHREHVLRALKEDASKMQGILTDASADLNAYAEELGTATQAYFSTAFLGGDDDIGDYSHFSERMQNIVNQVTSGFGSDFYAQFLDDENPYESLTKYYDDMLKAFDSLGSAGIKEFEAAFNLKTQFNNGEISYGEYIQGIKNVEDLLSESKLDQEIQNQIKFTLDTEQIKADYDALKNRLTSEEYGIKMSDEEAEKYLNSLTGSKYQVAIDLIDDEDVDFGKFNSLKKLDKYLEEQAKINEAMAFTTNIEVDTTALEALNTALAESASAMGLTETSIDSLKAKYSKLESFDAATLFEATTNGIKVNREELAKLEKEYNDLTKSEVEEHLETLANEYNNVTAEIDKCTNAGERAQLISKREGYKTQIEELAEYQAQLEGVTGAYQRWIDAQNTPEDYEGYQAVATSREEIEDEIDRGFISNASKEYIDLLSGEDLRGGTIDDYAEAWENLGKKVGSTGYSIHDFFTTNDDGDITATGIDRFFEGVKKDFNGSVAKFNEETGKWTYDFSQENLQKIQDEWGIGIEAIGLLIEAAASAGYEVDWDSILDGIDLDTSNFETLVSYAEKAQASFNKLEGIEDVDFNFTATGVEEASSELEKAHSTYIDLITNDDGTINLKAEGAEQMRVILSALLIQKQQLEDSNIAINIDTSGLDESQQDIANAINAVKTFREKYKNLEIAVTTGQGIEAAKTELDKAMGELQTLGGEGVDIAAQLILGEGSSAEDLKGKVDAAITAVGEKNIKVGCKLNETAIGDLNSQILTNFTPEATVKITGIDDDLVNQFTSTEKTANGTVKWKNNDKLVVDFQKKVHKATGKVKWENDSKNLTLSGWKATGTVTWTSGNNVKVKVISSANGTANANGTTNTGRAFRQGDWGIKGSGTALVGELGMETLVRGGKFYTIGDTGAEFIQYRPNDIIFNHKQTEELFRYGKVLSDGGRGRVYADGSAFVNGSYPSSGRAFYEPGADVTESNFAAGRKEKNKTTITKTTTTTKTTTKTTASNKSSNSSSSNSSSTSDTKDTAEEFEETFDLVEIAISRLERAIDKLDQQANRTYKSWSSRNNALTKEIGKVGEEINLQEQAYKRYMQEANSVGLSSEWIKKIQNGEVDIETIKDEALAEKIKEYQDWYEKALDCKDVIEDLKDTEAELYKQRFDNVSTQYDGIIQGYEHTEAMLNEYISQAEAQGHIVSKKYYDALINNENQRISQLKQEQAALIAARDEAEANGIDKNSQDWLDMCADIDAVTQEIESGTTALIEYANAIRQIEWDTFDLIQERISAVTDEADFLIELMSNDELFDDKGKLTGQGAATLALHGQKHNTYMYQADEYGAEIADIDAKIASGEYDSKDQEVANRRQELLELQWESILAAEDEKQAIKDLVQEGIDKELDSLQELIDKKNESLQSEKDLYEYQKKVQEQTENIASLRKQMSAYENDNSEEAQAKLQELRVSLKDAETELKETEWDKYIQDTEQILDTLYTDYELILNQRLDNVDLLLSEVIAGINASATAITEGNDSLVSALGTEGTLASALGVEGAIATAIVNAVGENGSIKGILNTEATAVGTKLSNAMNGIWSVGEGNAKSILTMYGEDFKTKSTTTNTTLNGIKVSVDNLVKASNKEATKKTTANKTTTSAKKDPTKDDKPVTKPTTKPTTTTTTTTKGDGKAKVGDKVKFVSGQYYYDSQGKKPLGSKNRGKEVYITSINTKSWATHPYHISTGKKLGSGDLGWLKLNQLSGYASGKHNFSNNEWAWTQEGKKEEYIIRPSDGAILTPITRRGSVLNAEASNNLWNMSNSPAEFIRDNLKMDASNIPNGANVQSNLTQHFENIVFSMPNVHSYEEMLKQMQKDKSFEKLITAMTIDQIAGKSSLAKGKSIR